LFADDATMAGSAAAPDAPRDGDTSSSTDVTLPGAHRRRACVVSLGGRTLAVDVCDAREVMTLDTLGAVPGAPPPLLGLANLRGRVVPVTDARAALALPPRAARPGGVAIVLVAADLEAAVPIDAVLGLQWFDAPLPADGAPDDALSTFAIGLVPRPGEAAILLDAGRLLQALRAPWAPAGSETHA
jgi:chemotaxis signal transduction protein